MHSAQSLLTHTGNCGPQPTHALPQNPRKCIRQIIRCRGWNIAEVCMVLLIRTITPCLRPAEPCLA